MRNHTTLRVLGALTLCAGLLGCGDEDPDKAGVLVVPYELGNQKDCATVGVSRVRAVLDDELYLEEVGCEASQVRFNLVMPGTYDLSLYGLDDEGFAVMDSLEGGETSLNVIGNGQTVVADPSIKLTAAPAQLRMRWDLGFGSCQSASIEYFDVLAWRVDGSELMLQSRVPCAVVGEGPDGYRTIPDTERDLGGDELGEVNIQAYDHNDIEVGASVMFTFDAPGPGRPVDLSLDCTEGGCVGSGGPDTE